MSEVKDTIFSGPPLDFKVYDGSCGEYIGAELRKLPPNEITRINADTGESMTNAEFLELSQLIAVGLDDLGIAKDDIVVLLGHNSFRNFATATACFLQNVPFAPLDPMLKSYELTNMFTAYQPRLILCEKQQQNHILKALEVLRMTIPVFLFDVDEIQGDHENQWVRGFNDLVKHGKKDVKMKKVLEPSQEIAIVIPSSGSTGLPKGVALPHRSVVAFCCKMSQSFSSSKEKIKKGLQTSHLFWLSGLSSLCASYIGMTQVFLEKLDTYNILQAIKNYKPETTFMSPSELATILKQPDLSVDALSPLKIVVTGGGPLQRWVVDQIQEQLVNPPLLLQIYGLTENTGVVSKPDPTGDVLSAGKIESGIHLKFVDPNTGTALKAGETGEIRIKYPYQMICYLGHPDATKAAFDEDGWLCTGDLGYITDQGFLYIVGRMKSLIKYRNVQVSPIEIENLLIGMPGVMDVGVDGIPHEEDQYHTVALIVRSPGATITEADIHKYVEDNMASSNKLRGGVKFVDSIPRNVHKKLKRAELRELVLKLK